MSFENIILTGIVVVLAFMLFRSPNKETSRRRKSSTPAHKIRFVSEQTGEVIEMRLIDNSHKFKKELSEENFIANAKMSFQMIVDAFTKGDISRIKNLLMPDIYSAFEGEINKRKENKHVVDFSLICFDSVKILNTSVQKEEVKVTFVKEQINLLKDAEGNVIEGDEMSVATVTDTWTFRKKGRTKWVVSATKSGEIYG